MSTFDTAAATHLLATAFAPWVQELDLTVESVGKDSAIIRMRFSDKLCRDNGVVCGQSLMSLADTAMVVAISAAAGGYFPMTTVDQTSHFLRPALRTDVLAEAKVIRLGKTMAFATTSIRPVDDERPVALAQSAYALMREGK